jgi:hypothetical protein
MYKIMGKYDNHDVEELDSADTKQEAEYLVGEYRLAFGTGWEIWIVR